jgi:RNA polymerase sigma-70 factor (ECF subfamily)
MDSETDEQIVERVQAGEHNSFGLLIDRYEPKLQRYARRFLAVDEDVEDQVQEVFIKTYTNIQSFDITKRFSPWIYRIAHNTFVNELRRHKKTSYSLFDLDTFLPFVATSETADSDSIQNELAGELESFLDKIDEKYRAPLVLYFYEQLSYQEISEVLRIPAMTVGVRLTRGKEKLKKLYEINNK